MLLDGASREEAGVEKKKQETKKSPAEVRITGFQVLLMEMKRLLTFPPGLALANDPNLFIGDGGASAHSTRSAVGL
jgi:hypothetical protein